MSTEIENVTATTDESTLDQDFEQEEPITPGKYIAEITGVSLTQHVREGYDIVKMDFRISGGQYSGQRCNKVFHLKSAKIKAYLQKEFGLLGIVVETRIHLLNKYLELQGKLVQIELKNDLGNTIIYIQGDAKKEIPKIDPESIWSSKPSAGVSHLKM